MKHAHRQIRKQNTNTSTSVIIPTHVQQQTHLQFEVSVQHSLHSFNKTFLDSHVKS